MQTTYGAVAAGERHLQRATEPDNVRVWDGRSRGHYEVWYLTLNHRPSRTGFWIRYTLEAPYDPARAPYAQLWFAAFDADDPSRNFALNRKFPIAEHDASSSPFEIRIGEASLGHGHARGALEGDGHRARWDLAWLPAARTHRHLPPVVYGLRPIDTKVLSPNLDVPVRGAIEMDGRVLTLDGEPGGQTHLWGRKHAHAWAWGHCNAFEGRRGAALEALSVRLKRRGVVLPPLTLVSLYLDGEEHRLNGFDDVIWNRGWFRTCRYEFLARGRDVKIVGEYVCRPEDMITTPYEDPDGEASFCANTEVADLRVTVYRRSSLFGAWREAARLYAPKTGHFEIGGRAPDPAIERRHVAV